MFELIKFICQHLEKNKIEYMLSGSIVLSVYGLPRFTRDVDIVINIKQEDTENFIAGLSDEFYFNKETILHEIDIKGMFNIIHQKSSYKIDFVVKKDNEFRDTEFQRKQLLSLSDFKAWVVTIEDLIISKLIWIQTYHSDLQMSDIRYLLTRPGVDMHYVKSWCEKLKLSTFNIF